MAKPRRAPQGQISDFADMPAERTYGFDSCPSCGRSSFTNRIRVYKCGACYKFFCTECRILAPLWPWISWAYSCPHCGARDSGIYMGRA
jgi:hypothetical protein